MHGRQQEGIRQGQKDHQKENKEAREKLAENDMRVFERVGPQQLDGAEFFLLRKQAHGQQRQNQHCDKTKIEKIVVPQRGGNIHEVPEQVIKDHVGVEEIAREDQE